MSSWSYSLHYDYNSSSIGREESRGDDGSLCDINWNLYARRTNGNNLQVTSLGVRAGAQQGMSVAAGVGPCKTCVYVRFGLIGFGKFFYTRKTLFLFLAGH